MLFLLCIFSSNINFWSALSCHCLLSSLLLAIFFFLHVFYNFFLLPFTNYFLQVSWLLPLLCFCLFSILFSCYSWPFSQWGMIEQNTKWEYIVLTERKNMESPNKRQEKIKGKIVIKRKYFLILIKHKQF